MPHGHHKHGHKHKHRHRHRSDSSSDSSSSSSSSSGDERSSVVESSGYSNSSNPFGDERLTEQFVWKAKLDKLKREGVDTKQYMRDRPPRALEDLRAELARVRERREQRDAEREQWTEERERLEREAGIAELGDWEAKEGEFHLEQAAKRAEIRVADGRPRPADVLYTTLHMTCGGAGLSARDPAGVVAGVATGGDALLEMRKDVSTFLELDAKVPAHRDWWTALLVVIDDTQAAAAGRAEPVHPEVAKDVERIFAGKNSAELEALRKNVMGKIGGGNAVDVEYWESLLKRLTVQIAKTRLREMHSGILALAKQKDPSLVPGAVPVFAAAAAAAASAGDERGMGEAAKKKQKTEDGATDEDMYAAEVARQVDDNETAFNAEVELPAEKRTCTWQEKYRPRKPRFYNRVITGYDWNRYNQSHYDHDNPPPKIVLGFKFNIFYPDLIDKSQTPKYFKEPDPEGDPEFLQLRFHAGPPYEDVAFRIVNREWQFAPKHGFKCIFEKGILHLWFKFKRIRYRK